MKKPVVRTCIACRQEKEKKQMLRIVRDKDGNIKLDFTGKTIHPFCTHEGSGLGRSEGDIRRLCPTARVEPGLAIPGSRAGSAEGALRAWCGK